MATPHGNRDRDFAAGITEQLARIADTLTEVLADECSDLSEGSRLRLQLVARGLQAAAAVGAEAVPREQALFEQIRLDDAVIYGPGGVAELGLRFGLAQPLRDAGVHTVHEVRQKVADGSIRWIWGYGPKRIQELRAVVQRYDERGA